MYVLLHSWQASFYIGLLTQFEVLWDQEFYLYVVDTMYIFSSKDKRK